MLAGGDAAKLVERLDPETRMRERIMLGLRMQEGVDLGEVAQELEVEPLAGGRAQTLELLEARGRITRSGLRVSVPRDAWIWVDQTAAALF
jgi:coproporphyrinogen III oxidase-like Fe-S oxidoreductase